MKTDVTLMIEINLECSCDFRSLMNNTRMTHFYIHMQKIAKPVMDFMFTIQVPVVNVKTELSLQHIVPSKWMSPKFKDCTWVVQLFDKDNFKPNMENNTITIVSSIAMDSSLGKILDNVVLTCQGGDENDVNTGFVPPPYKVSNLLSFYIGFYEIVKPATPLEDCIWTIYEPTDIESYDYFFVLDDSGSIMDFNLSKNDSLTISLVGESYEYGMYDISYNGIVVCESNLIEIVVGKLDTILLIVAVFCLLFSLFFILIYLFFFIMKDERLQLQLVIFLLFIHISLCMAFILSNISAACTIGSAILTLCILGDFTWINTMVVDTWLALRSSDANEKHSYLVHYISGWGIPVILTALYICLHYTGVYIIFGPDFEQFRCWYKDKYAALIFIVIPTGVSVLLNVFFMSLTFFNICQPANKSLPEMTSPVKLQHIKSCIRLVSLEIVTWILGLASEFTEQKTIRYMFVILISIQGMFISLCFVWDILKINTDHEVSAEPSTGEETGSDPV